MERSSMRPWAKVGVLSGESGRVPFPVDGGEELVGLGGVFLDRQEIVGGVGADDDARGLAGGVQGIEGQDAPRDVDLFEQGAHGGDLSAVVIEAEGRDGRLGGVLDQGRGLEVPVSVAVGAPNPLAVHRNRAAQLQPGRREASQHGLDLLRVHRRDHPVQGGLGDRDVAAGLGILPGADRLQFLLAEHLGVLGGGDRPAQVREAGEEVDAEHRGDRMLAPLAAPEVLHLGQLLVQGAQLARALVASRSHSMASRVWKVPGTVPLTVNR